MYNGILYRHQLTLVHFLRVISFLLDISIIINMYIDNYQIFNKILVFLCLKCLSIYVHCTLFL